MNTSARTFLAAIAVLTLAAVVLTPWLTATHAPVKVEAARSGPSFEQDGFRVTMQVTALRGGGEAVRAWEDTELAFTVAEARDGGRPLTGLAPLAWLVRRELDEPVPDRDTARREIRALLAGRLAKASDVNLNEYLVVTLDDNNSLSIIDPQLESAKTKTVGMVPLQAPGADFELAPDRRTILVTLPSVGRLAAADLERRMARYVDLAGAPSELALQPDGFYVWTGDEGGERVHVVRTEDLALERELRPGAGPHVFAFTPDSRQAWVLARGAGTLVVYDVHTLAELARFELGPDARALVLSPSSLRAYAARADGRVAVFDPDGPARLEDVELPAGLTDFVLEPSGRHAFALYRESDTLEVVDLSTGRLRHTVETERAPERLEFTAGFGYLTHAESERTILIELATLAQEGRVLASSLTMGQLPPLAGHAPTRAPLLAPLPEGGGAMLLSPADRNLYHFMEGMNAPMGAYRTFPWPARGVLLVDRTLQERDPGRYVTTFTAPAPGSYSVFFVLPSSPQLYGAFSLEFGGLPRVPETWKSLRYELVGPAEIASGRTQTLELALFDAESLGPVADLVDVALLVRRGPRWQWNGVAVPRADGRYTAELTFPEPGRYQLFLACPSRGIELVDLPARELEVRAGETVAVVGKE